jgi:hypothetical protein
MKWNEMVKIDFELLDYTQVVFCLQRALSNSRFAQHYSSDTLKSKYWKAKSFGAERQRTHEEGEL